MRDGTHDDDADLDRPLSPGSTPARDDPADELATERWERFLAGEANASHDAEPGAGEAADTLRAAIRGELAGSSEPPALDAQAFLGDLETRFARLGHPVRFARTARARTSRIARAVGIACAAGLTALVVASHPAPLIRSATVGPGDTGTFRAPGGGRLRVRLAGGAEVGLSPGSSVRIARPCSGCRPEVFVAGEVHVRGPDAPEPRLTVHARNAVLETAGARFTVRTDTDAHEVRVAVVAGVVMVGDSGARWRAARVLTSGMLGLVTATGAAQAFRPRNPDAFLAWEAGVYRMPRDRLRDALPSPAT